MPDRTRWGILSTALINQKVLAGARRSTTADVIAVASRNEERATAYAQANSIPRAYGSYDALLADPDVDAVYISLPNALHHSWTLRALAAGKHVLCEKPYSARARDVEQAFTAAERGRLVLSEAYMYRYNPQIIELKRIVDEGAIGELRFISAAFTWPCDAPGDIRLAPELDGGSLLDVGCYCVSAARLLAGEPIGVTAQQIIGPTGVEIRLVGTLAFDAGVLALFDSGFHLPDRSYLEVVGSDAAIRVSDPWHCLQPALDIIHPNGHTTNIPFEVTNSYALELDHVHAAIHGDPTTLLGLSDAVGQARCLEALAKAAAETPLLVADPS